MISGVRDEAFLGFGDGVRILTIGGEDVICGGDAEGSADAG
jgi:hypothetical protein